MPEIGESASWYHGCSTHKLEIHTADRPNLIAQNSFLDPSRLWVEVGT